MPDVICGLLCVQEEERFWDEVVKAGVLLTPGEVPPAPLVPQRAHRIACKDRCY